MSYTINKTDGSILTEIVDGTIDQTATDLTLVGKNALSYGEAFNENFVKILENFSSTSSPSNPITGQIWYDTSESRLKVYNGSTFKVAAGTIVSDIIPSSITQGDVWIDSKRQQLYFNDGIATRLAGPQYTAAQGLSGFSVADIIDLDGISHTIAQLYVGSTLIGIFSKATFYPSAIIPGFGTASIIINETPTTVSKQIITGYTASDSNGGILKATASVAQSLLAADGSLATAESFLPVADDAATSGTLSILNTKPLVLGAGGLDGSTEVRVLGNSFQINSLTTGQTLQFNLKDNTGTSTTAFHINGNSKYVGIYTSSPTKMLDVAGDARIRGSLTVEGTLVSISSTNLEITDKLIELAKVATPTDVTAEAGGISLAGATSKTITWSATGTNWTSSENWNILTGKVYKINNVSVLSSTTLGTSVVTSSLTSVGTLTGLSTTYTNISNSATVSGVTGTITSSTATTTITGLSTTVGMYPGQIIIETGTNAGSFGTNATIRNIDSTTQITISASTANTAGLITFSTSSGPIAATIKFVNASVTNGTIVLGPKGTGTVDVSSTRITSVAAPVYNNDASTKLYTDTVAQTLPLTASLRTTGWTNTQIAALVTKIFPPSEHLLASVSTTYCRVTCYDEGTTHQVAAASLVAGITYVITIPGDTIWTNFGAYSTGVVGTVFTMTGTGTGTGYAAPYIRRFALSGSPTPSWAYLDNL